MGQVISFDVARATRACQSISSSAETIAKRLSSLSADTAVARKQLEDAEARLEKSIAQFDAAQQRLKAVQKSHRQMMALIDVIQSNSIAFDGLNPTAS